MKVLGEDEAQDEKEGQGGEKKEWKARQQHQRNAKEDQSRISSIVWLFANVIYISGTAGVVLMDAYYPNHATPSCNISRSTSLMAANDVLRRLFRDVIKLNSPLCKACLDL